MPNLCTCTTLKSHVEAHRRHHVGRAPARRLGRRRAIPRARRTTGLQRTSTRVRKTRRLRRRLSILPVSVPERPERRRQRVERGLSQAPTRTCRSGSPNSLELRSAWTPTGNPKTLLLNARQPEISRCPFIMMTEPGGAYFDDEEVVGLRKYLQKGGFLWADDFWGEYAWSYWENADPAGVAVGTVSNLRRPHRPHTVPRDVYGQGISANSWHWPLGRRRSHVGATRCTPGAPARDQRRPRPDHGPHDPQHGLRRLLRAGSGRSGVLHEILSARVRVRHQRLDLRDDPRPTLDQTAICRCAFSKSLATVGRTRAGLASSSSSPVSPRRTWRRRSSDFVRPSSSNK